ncbi:hypothetical protein LXT13_11030 [Pelomonas sp. P8]|uniref:Uncharacterized protein n=2 Tax=Pelomonas cellulosilytica TaxID=2906762 RepID=A0ABS8XQD5_9BURK|nr:hypothetical protein [Pelomonas sp. P8]
MANRLSKSRREAPAPTSHPSDEENRDDKSARLHEAWNFLDEASNDLVRAEAIVDLLGLEMQASRHQLYAATIAGEFLRAASARVSEARELVRPANKRGVPTGAVLNGLDDDSARRGDAAVVHAVMQDAADLQ